MPMTHAASLRITALFEDLAHCPYQKLHPTVFMVKSAEDRSCGNLT